MDLPFEKNIKCSNYVGETIDMAIDMGVKGILFVMEVLAANGIRAGADLECARKILECNTTDEALQILEQNGILKPAMEQVMKRIQFYLNHRSYDQILLGAVVFSNVYGYLGMTEDAPCLIRKIQKEHKGEL